MRHRTKSQVSSDDSSSDDDVFSALSRKKTVRKKATTASSKTTSDSQRESFTINKTSSQKYKEVRTMQAMSNTNAIGSEAKAPDGAVKGTVAGTTSETSSNKRHHHQSSQRAAKMDALLQELQETPIVEASATSANIPEKTGSYCFPGEEHSTTNIFVGNLSPLTTEEQLTSIFKQFGDLYSVKIMWPRTPEEQARGRNTGFVCFMNRDDAQDAMDTLQDSDPLNNGRRMFLNWGKNVKKVVKRGAGGISKTSTDWTKEENEVSDPGDGQRSEVLSAAIVQYDPTIHASDAIRVIPPSNLDRFKFISTVAEFVAKDGSVLEDKMIETESNNPQFSFLNQHSDDDAVSDEIKMERIFYRWRVYSFSQGDTYGTWRIQPFIMVQPGGRFWIPPPIDPKLSAQKKIEVEIEEEQMQMLKQQRRNMIAARRGYTKARSSKDFKPSAAGPVKLTFQQLEEWNEIIQNLCGSKEAICEAMAFCFDNSVAYKHISQLLKEVLSDTRLHVSVETKCARLYLLSDILYNAQQPHVKNAFRFREEIESMAPEVFKCLGQHGDGNAGRITMNKLRLAVKRVLDAWDSWSVYSVHFLKQLEGYFENDDTIAQNYESDANEGSSKESIGSDTSQIQESIPASTSIWIDTSDRQRISGKRAKVDKEGDGDVPDITEIDPSTLIDEELDGQSLGSSEIAYSDYGDDNIERTEAMQYYSTVDEGKESESNVHDL